jgi:hypothetical protein
VWIKDLNIRHEAMQLVHKTARTTLEAIGISKDFLTRTPAAQKLRERKDKWDCMKLKSFCITKEMVSKLKSSPTDWEKIFCWLYTRQRTDNQNTKGTQKTKLLKNQ